jgi:PAS domain S-box-containing protein
MRIARRRACGESIGSGSKRRILKRRDGITRPFDGLRPVTVLTRHAAGLRHIIRAVTRPEYLDRVTRSRDAAFAVDPAGRIVAWNRRCEELVGWTARNAIGRHCWDLIDGHDASGNLYCYRSCPIAFHARQDPGSTARDFPLCVKCADRSRKPLLVSTHVVREKRAVVAIVHFLRETAARMCCEDREVVTVGAPAADGHSRKSSGIEPAVLTPRETEILRYLAEGLTTAQIAEMLFISPVTVRNHIQRILQKFGVHTKLAAVAFAYQHDLV